MTEGVVSNLRYSGKVAIVTGGSKGIGEGIVREFGKKFKKFVPCYFEKGVGASIEAVAQ